MSFCATDCLVCLQSIVMRCRLRTSSMVTPVCRGSLPTLASSSRLADRSRSTSSRLVGTRPSASRCVCSEKKKVRCGHHLVRAFGRPSSDSIPGGSADGADLETGHSCFPRFSFRAGPHYFCVCVCVCFWYSCLPPPIGVVCGRRPLFRDPLLWRQDLQGSLILSGAKKGRVGVFVGVSVCLVESRAHVWMGGGVS